jgi:hypothetical protein
VTFHLSNGDDVTLGGAGDGSYAAPGFFGVTDSTPFDSVLMTSSDVVLNLNDVSYSEASSTIPEPAIWLLVAGGLLGAAVLRRRRVN